MLSTKQLIFTELSSPKTADGFVSGQDLARICGVSRTAVWKAVQSLIKEDIQIEASTNRGYRLKGEGTLLSEEILEAVISQNKDEKNIRFKVFKTIDSTNMEAKRLCANAGFLRDCSGNLTQSGTQLHKLVILADQQTAGRGRLGRPFYSPEQSGIYLSMIYVPKHSIIQPAKMTAAAAVAVCRALKKIYSLDAQIKWVNDIFINGKKVCGILTEGVSNFETGGIEAAIIGIGVNICSGAGGFPANIAKVAGTLLASDKGPVLRNELAAEIAAEIAGLYDEEENCPGSAKTKQIMEEYKERSMILGKELEVTQVIGTEKKYSAKAVDIADDASLVVELKDGTLRKLQSGEVSLSSVQFSHS